MVGKDSKDRLWSWEDVNKNNKKKKNPGEIHFKQDSRKRNLIGIIKGLGLVLLAIVSGTVSANYFVNRLNESGAIKGNSQTIIVEKNEGNSIETNFVYSTVQSVAPSVVGIGESEESFLVNPLENKKNVSGFIIRTDGYIVTNYHGIKNYERILVKLSGEASNPIEAELKGYDEDSDIAILKINAHNLMPVTFGEISSMKPGDMVIAISNSSGELYVGTVTTGIVSSISKKLQVTSSTGEQTAYAVIQSNLKINDYNDGAVLIDASGKVVGINSKAINKEVDAEGLNHSIAIEEINKIIKAILSTGQVKKATLGIIGEPLVASEEGDIEGIYVQSVTPDSGAAKAGIIATDKLIEIDEQKVRTWDDVYAILENKEIKDVVSVVVLREGQRLELSVELSELGT